MTAIKPASLEELHPRVAEAIRQFALEAEVLQCDPDLADTAAFCESYSIPAEETCNAIVVVGKTDPPTYVCCVILGFLRAPTLLLNRSMIHLT